MTQDEIIEMAVSNGFYKNDEGTITSPFIEDVDISELLLGFAEDVAAKEREAIADEFWSCVMSDLENGVKSLNEKASFDFQNNMPELSKFGRWLNERDEA